MSGTLSKMITIQSIVYSFVLLAIAYLTRTSATQRGGLFRKLVNGEQMRGQLVRVSDKKELPSLICNIR